MASIRSVASKLLTSRSGAASGFLHNYGFRGLTSRPVIRPPAAGFLNTNNRGGYINPFQSARVLASRPFSTNNTSVDMYPGSDDFSVLDILGGFSPSRRLARKFKRFTNFPAKFIKPSKVDDTSECTYVYIRMDGIKPEKVNVYFDRGAILIEGEAADELTSAGGFKKYVCWYYLKDIDSPDKIYNFSNIKAEMNLKNVGELKVTIPKLQENQTRFVVKVVNGDR